MRSGRSGEARSINEAMATGGDPSCNLRIVTLFSGEEQDASFRLLG